MGKIMKEEEKKERDGKDNERGKEKGKKEVREKGESV